MLFLCQKHNREKKIHSSPIPPNPNLVSENNCLFSGICGTILQQWFICFPIENLTDHFGENSVFGWRSYLWNPDFISFEIDLESQKNLEDRMEKQCFESFEHAFGGVFFVSFFVGYELLPPTAFRKNENRKGLHRCRFA